MTATGDAASTAEPSCQVVGCGRPVVDAGLCLADLVRAVLAK